MKLKQTGKWRAAGNLAFIFSFSLLYLPILPNVELDISGAVRVFFLCVSACVSAFFHGIIIVFSLISITLSIQRVVGPTDATVVFQGEARCRAGMMAASGGGTLSWTSKIIPSSEGAAGRECWPKTNVSVWQSHPVIAPRRLNSPDACTAPACPTVSSY